MAPLADEKTNDIVHAALRFLRNTGRPVIRGIRRDKSWMHDAGSSFATTADLITQVFADDLPRLLPIASQADDILAGINPVATLFTETNCQHRPRRRPSACGGRATNECWPHGHDSERRASYIPAADPGRGSTQRRHHRFGDSGSDSA